MGQEVDVMIHTLVPRTTLGWLPVEKEAVTREPALRLFRQDHRGTATLGTVAAVVVAFCVNTGVMWKTYREGASPRAQCELICRGP
jgi:hypothetical protein